MKLRAAIIKNLGTKLKLSLAMFFLLTSCCISFAQSYRVDYKMADPDSSAWQQASLRNLFASRAEAMNYIRLLPSSLQSKGFVTASIDSIQSDSVKTIVNLYLGEQYKWARVKTSDEEEEILQSVRWPKNGFSGSVDFSSFFKLQQRSF